LTRYWQKCLVPSASNQGTAYCLPPVDALTFVVMQMLGSGPAATLPGPAREITVEPIRVPREEPVPVEPKEPEREPPAPEPEPQKEPEKVPA
jgi:hypothetical protein